MKHIRELIPQTEGEIAAMAQRVAERAKNFAGCESPVEDDFLRCYYKVKVQQVKVTGQTVCQTRVGNFRLDFVLSEGGRKIGFECDGKQFHDKERDRIRDESMLETGFVEVIYRVPGSGL